MFVSLLALRRLANDSSFIENVLPPPVVIIFAPLANSLPAMLQSSEASIRLSTLFFDVGAISICARVRAFGKEKQRAQTQAHMDYVRCTRQAAWRAHIFCSPTAMLTHT